MATTDKKTGNKTVPMIKIDAVKRNLFLEEEQTVEEKLMLV